MYYVRHFTWLLAILSTVSLLAAQPAPSFSLPTNSSSQIDLDSLRGKVVCLDFWASWCDPCRKSFPWMDSLQSKYGERGFTVVAVNLDKKREAAMDFLEKHSSSFPIAFDPTGTTAEKYGVKGMPNSFLIDRVGNIVFTHLGFREADKAMLEQQIEKAIAK